MERVYAPMTVNAHGFLGVWTWNVKTGIVVACSDVCGYMGIPSEVGIHGVATERFRQGIHPDDHAELDRQVGLTLDGADTFLAEYRIVSAPHGTVWVRSTGRCFRDPSGQPTHISGYLTRIERTDSPDAEDEAALDEVIAHLTRAREAAARLSRPLLGKLIAAVMLEAGFQLASRLKRN